jgi:hypothetical protein
MPQVKGSSTSSALTICIGGIGSKGRYSPFALVVQVPYDGPRRASLRQKGVDADGRMIDQELRNGQVVLNSAPGGGASSWVSAGESAAGEPKERHPKGGSSTPPNIQACN